jgi:hypothetical protein
MTKNNSLKDSKKTPKDTSAYSKSSQISSSPPTTQSSTPKM